MSDENFVLTLNISILNIIIVIAYARESANKFKLLSTVPYKILEGHTKEVVDLSWSRRDSRYLLTASLDRSVRLWVITEDKVPVSFRFHHPDFVSSVDFHPRLGILFMLRYFTCSILADLSLFVRLICQRLF